jgi:Big-like domain-containing protein/hemolysin type calcium-binding protein
VPESRLLRATPLAVAAALLLVWSGSAIANDDERQRSARAIAKDRATSSVAPLSPAEQSLRTPGRSAFSVTGNFLPAHHDGSDLHLPPTQHNIELVGELEMDTPADLRAPGTEDDAVLPGQIADVAIHKGFAYLNSWDEPTCQRGGTFVVDINDPENPEQVAFLPALEGRYHGEGAHAITLNTPAFQGDILAVNNEPYTTEGCTDDILGNGGFDLYDVTNPREPEMLVQGIGDTGPEGELEGDFETANSSHSTFVWQGNDRRAYVVFVDNTELHDVDIFEITDPANPQPVGEFDLVEVAAAQGVDIVDSGGLGGAADIFFHDMVVKKIGDRFIMLADYWDAGYLTFDVTNPANPTYIADTTFDGPDPLTGKTPQEGNGHQGEFSHDNEFILAADEDFSPYRPGTFEITTGDNAGEFPSVSVGGGASASFLEDLVMNGPTVYGGYGCDASAPIPDRDTAGLPPLEDGEEAIVVLQRGPGASTDDPPVPDDPEGPEEACFPGEKAANGIEAGYDAVLLVNHHRGEEGGVFCGSGDFPASPPIVTVCTSHEAFHHIFNSDPTTEIPYDPANEPDVGDLGEYVSADSEFDGWGYTHLYRAETTPTGGKQLMEHIDSYAIESSLNPDLAFGYGDLSVHEFATDPDQNIAYSSYYAGGMRVFTFSEDGLTEQGRFIDDEGSNFWGVEQFTTASGERLFAGSDRDFGLQIFRYTGPPAPSEPVPANQKPVCRDSVVMVPFKGSASVPLTCSDDENNPLTRAVVAGPSAGTVSGDANTGAVTYQHTGTTLGTADTFTFRANDGTANSNDATVTIVTGARDGGRCFNPFTGTAASESLAGSPFGDNLSGNSGNDMLLGLEGDDCLRGEGGRDELQGHAGRDRLEGGASADRLSGGRGADDMFGGGGNDSANGSSGADEGNGGSGNDRASLGSGNDRFRGGAGRDSLGGGSGRDRLFGQNGNDRLDADGGSRNLLSGGAGRDRLLAVNGNRDTIRCGGGRDSVRADANDRVARDCESVRRARR